MRTWWWWLALAACSSSAEEAPATEPLNVDRPAEPPVETRTDAALVSALGFVGVVDGTAEGFDLDGVTSDASDDQGCGHVDAVDSAGRTGIDNTFAGLVPVLMATEASALEDLLRQSIANGQLLMVIDVTTPLDDPGACADVTVWRGVGAPLLGSDGAVLDAQTLGVIEPVTVSCVPVVDGVVEARGFSLDLPLQVLDVDVVLHLQNVAIRAEMGPDGWTGILGAGIPVEDIEQILDEDDIADLAELLRPLVQELADLFPDADGHCTAVSATLAFDALPAFVEPL